MNAFELIKNKLKKYPQITFKETENLVSVLPTSNKGFTVSLELNQDIFTVFYNGWHEDFKSEEEALNCFALGLSNECRLEEFCRNGEHLNGCSNIKTVRIG